MSPRTGVVELTEHNFASSIDGHPFAVIDFWAPSCAPCHAFAPIFAAAAARSPDILFAKVNTEEQRAIAAQFNIRSTPTLMIFRSNIVVHARPGALQAGALDEVISAARALDMQQVQRKVVSVDGVALPAPAVPARAGAEVDDVIGRVDHFQIVLDDQDRVSQVAQLAQHVDQPACIPLVQANCGFVEDIEQAGQVGTQEGGQP